MSSTDERHERRQAELNDLGVRAAAGDQAALQRLLNEIQPDVLRRCGRFLPNRLDAEEACQDVLLTVARKIGSFEGRSKFTTWLYPVVGSRCLDTYRRLKRHQLGPNEMVDMADDRRTSVIAGTRIDLLEALENTDQKFADPVVLRDLCGLDYNEIAVALDVPVGTIKSRISEGRKRLQHQMS